MEIVNTRNLKEDSWQSPKGNFGGFGKNVSLALGRKPKSMNLDERHPFDVEILRIEPGKKPYPYHSHSAQWEFYHVLSGKGKVRHENGNSDIVEGDAFLFKPGEPHQIINNGDDNLIIYVIADNPVGESCHYPDSGKWFVGSPERRLVRSEPLDYFDGEE